MSETGIAIKAELLAILYRGGSIRLEADEVCVSDGFKIVRRIKPNPCRNLKAGTCQKHNQPMGSASDLECKFGLFICWEGEKP